MNGHLLRLKAEGQVFHPQAEVLQEWEYLLLAEAEADQEGLQVQIQEAEGKMGRYIQCVIALFLMLGGFFTTSFAQNDADLFRFSKHYHGGSARFEAMGGAFGALGADISSAQVNPAGMGRF